MDFVQVPSRLAYIHLHKIGTSVSRLLIRDLPVLLFVNQEIGLLFVLHDIVERRVDMITSAYDLFMFV